METIPRTTMLGSPSAYDSSYPHNILMVLLGDYWNDRSVPIPSSVLVRLLAEFGFSEGSARQTIRRLTERGHLSRRKAGRQTSYVLAPHRAEDAEHRRQLMSFARPFDHWDGLWTVVSFTVPEKVRDARRQLRVALGKLGMRPLNDAVWVSPRDTVAASERLLDKLDIEAAHVFRASLHERAGTKDALAVAFDLDDVAGRYTAFIERYETAMDAIGEGQVTPADALIHRTKLMADWLAFRFVDPVLPSELLPADWPAIRARSVFAQSYDGLGATSVARFRQLAQATDPAAPLAVGLLHSRDFGL